LVVSGGKLIPGGKLRLGFNAGGVALGVGGAPPRIIDGGESGALALDGVLKSVDALVPDSLEVELQDIIPSIASRLTDNAAIRLLTRHIEGLHVVIAEKISRPKFACRYVLVREGRLSTMFRRVLTLAPVVW